MTSDPQRRARVFVISTPKGITNDFYKLWVKGQEDKTGLWKSWQFTAEDVRPDMKEEIELARVDRKSVVEGKRENKSGQV